MLWDARADPFTFKVGTLTAQIIPPTRFLYRSTLITGYNPNKRGDGMADTGLKTLIVDDEPIARKVLREELELFDEISIVGEAEDGEQALTQIAALRPDLVFLDLQMPGI